MEKNSKEPKIKNVYILYGQSITIMVILMLQAVDLIDMKKAIILTLCSAALIYNIYRVNKKSTETNHE